MNEPCNSDLQGLLVIARNDLDHARSRIAELTTERDRLQSLMHSHQKMEAVGVFSNASLSDQLVAARARIYSLENTLNAINDRADGPSRGIVKNESRRQTIHRRRLLPRRPLSRSHALAPRPPPQMTTDSISPTGFWDSQTPYHECSLTLAEWIADYLGNDKFTPVYDFGCGQGFYLQHLLIKGFHNLIGFEGDPPSVVHFNNILKQDLTIPFTLPQKGSVLFLEVGEHIPAQFTDIVLDNIAHNCATHLIMSWAVENQAGFGHVNCLNNDRVIPMLTNRGFTHLPDASAAARALPFGHTPWFENTLMIFRREASGKPRRELPADPAPEEDDVFPRGPGGE